MTGSRFFFVCVCVCVFVFFVCFYIINFLSDYNLQTGSDTPTTSSVTEGLEPAPAARFIFSSNGEMGTCITCRAPKRPRHAVRTLDDSSFNQTSQTVTHNARFLNLKRNQRQFKFTVFFHLLDTETCFVPFMERDPKFFFRVLTCFP